MVTDSADCRRIANATLDIWQTNTRGLSLGRARLENPSGPATSTCAVASKAILKVLPIREYLAAQTIEAAPGRSAASERALSLAHETNCVKHIVNNVGRWRLGLYEERVSWPGVWPDAPCRYLRFSALYADEEHEAQRSGWVIRQITGDHLHMLVRPPR